MMKVSLGSISGCYEYIEQKSVIRITKKCEAYGEDEGDGIRTFTPGETHVVFGEWIDKPRGIFGGRYIAFIQDDNGNY